MENNKGIGEKGVLSIFENQKIIPFVNTNELHIKLKKKLIEFVMDSKLTTIVLQQPINFSNDNFKPFITFGIDSLRIPNEIQELILEIENKQK